MKQLICIKSIHKPNCKIQRSHSLKLLYEHAEKLIIPFKFKISDEQSKLLKTLKALFGEICKPDQTFKYPDANLHSKEESHPITKLVLSTNELQELEELSNTFFEIGQIVKDIHKLELEEEAIYDFLSYKTKGSKITMDQLQENFSDKAENVLILLATYCKFDFHFENSCKLSPMYISEKDISTILNIYDVSKKENLYKFLHSLDNKSILDLENLIELAASKYLVDYYQKKLSTSLTEKQKEEKILRTIEKKLPYILNLALDQFRLDEYTLS